MLIDPREPLSLTTSTGTEAYRNYWPGPDDTMMRFMDRSIDLLDALDRESDTRLRAESPRLRLPHGRSVEAARLRMHASPTTQFVDSVPAILERYPFVTDRVLAMLHVRRAGFMNAMKLGQ